MTQQIINLGSGPDTQTGDSLYTAFTKVNDNFTELYSVFDGNGISNINANVIISNNIVVTSNVRTGNIAAYGNIETIGYVITSGAFYPNGIPIGSLGAVSSNVLPLTTNLYTIGSQSLQFAQGYFSTNITLAGSNVTVREGALFVDGQIASGNYGNSNVAAFLPIYSGNIDATITTALQPYITQTGTLSNLTANTARIYGNLVIEGNLSVDGNVTFFNVDNLLVEDPIITLNTGANGSPLTFDNGFDSGIQSYYYDTENRKSFFGRKDDTGYFEYYSNVITDVGNIVSGTYGTFKTGNLLLTADANITGNVTGNNFLGNGRFLTGIDATSIQNGNSNVKVYANGNVSVTTAGANTWNFGTAGQLTVPGAILTTNNSKLDLVGFGANTAYLTTTADDSTALFMGAAVVELRAKDYISITTNTDDTSYLWIFAEDGNLTLPGNLTTSSNVIANYFLGNFIGNIAGNISAAGANTQILFNDNNTVNAVSGLTFNKSSNLLSVDGTISSLSVNVAGYNVIDSNGNVVTNRLIDSGVTAGTYGNASAVPIITVDEKGRVTNVTTTAVAGVSNLIYDSTTSNLTISTSAGTEFTVDLGVGAQDSPVFANTTITGNLFAEFANANTIVTDGTAYLYNISSTGLASLTSVNVLGSIDVAGNLSTNNLIIDSYISGNLIPNANVVYDLGSNNLRWKDLYLSGSSIYLDEVVISANLSGLTISSNVTTNNIVSNGSGTFESTLQAKAGLQNTVIGNVTPTQAFFTSVDVNGNAAVNALAINANAQIGGRLTVNSGIQNTLIGNEITSSGAFTAVTAHIIGNVGTTFFGNTYTANDGFNGALNGTLGQAGGNTAIISELSVTGNASINRVIANTSINAPVIISNVVLAEDINANGFVAVDSITVNTNAYFNNGISAAGNINANDIFSNGKITAQDTISAVAGIQGTVIGNVVPRSAFFRNLTANGTALINALNVNANATIGTTLDVTGNTEVGNLRTAGTILITNTTNSTGANTGALVVQGGASFEKDVYVLGNVYTTNLVAVNANTLSVQDPLLYLTANTPYPYNYDIGFFSQFQTGVSSGYQHTGFVRDVDDGTWKLFSNVVPDPTTTVSFDDAVYDNLLTGTHTVLGQIIGNSTLSVYGNATVGNLFANNNISAQNLNVSGLEVVGNVTVGELTVTNSAIITGILQAPGGLQNTIIGNVNPNSAHFTVLDVVGNASLGNLTVNGTSNFSSNITVSGNATAGNVITSSIFVSNIIASSIALNSQSSILANGNVIPTVGNIYSLGNITRYWSDLFTNTITVGNTITSGANINANGISIIGSGVFGSTIQAAGGIQNTVIGNVISADAYFTNVNISNNLIVDSVTVNNSVNISNTLSVLGNITAPYFIGNILGNISGNVAAPGSNRQVMFNDNSIISGDSGFIYNKDIETLTLGGNLDLNYISASGGAEFKGQVVVDGGIQNTVIGNVNPASAIFTTQSVSGNSTVNALTVNSSATFGTSVSALGGLQATPIGNVVPSTAQFTTVDASGNVTVNELTVNNSATIGGTLDVDGAMLVAEIDIAGHANVGNLQISGNLTGNLIPSANAIYSLGSANYRFKDLYLSGNTLYLGGVVLSSDESNFIIAGNVISANVFAPIIGNSGTDFVGETVNLSGNATVAAITVNSSITAGSSLSALGGLQATPIGNVTPSTAQFTSVDSSGNITASGLTVNSSAVLGNTLQALGGIQGTVIGNVVPSTAQFTTVNASGNITAAALTVNSSLTSGTTISAAGGLQATPIGNIVPSTAQFTTVDTSGNTTVNALSVNNSVTIGTTLSVTGSTIVMGGLQTTAIGNVTPGTAIFTTESVSGNSTVNALTVNTSAVINNTLQAVGGIQATPIGNVAASTGQFTSVDTTGNITAANITSNGSITAGAALIVAGGIQNTVIGNVTPSSAQFTTLNTSGNITADNITVNSGATVGTTLSAAGGLQATPIGNITPSTAQFTSVNASGTATVNNLIINTSILTDSLDVNANAVIDALSVNNSVTVGDTLGVTANINGSGLTLSGSQTVIGSISSAGGLQATPVGNSVASTGTFTNITGDSLTITGNTILGNLDVLGTVTYINSEITTLKDPIIELNTGPNGAPLSGSAPYDSGIKTHYWDGATDRSAFFGRSNSSGYFEFYSNVTNETSNVITGTLGTVRTGNIELTGVATIADTLTVGANALVNGLNVNTSAIVGQTLQVQGGLQNTVIGNVVPTSAQFTEVSSSGNITAQNITVNASVTANGNISAPYFIGNIIGNITGNISAAGANTQILFNDNSLVGASNQFTFDKSANLLTVGGNINASGLTITGSSTFTSVVSSQGGIQNTAIGNITPASALFTTVDINSNATVNALSVNNTVTIGDTLGVVGNINGNSQTLTGSQTVAGSLSAAGGLQSTPIGNSAASSAQFTTVSATGNITASAITANGSLTTGTTLTAAGGIQATPIGNLVPDTAQFTTLGSSGNATVNALTVNGSAVIGTTLSVQAGIQNTAIGNVNASTGKFTTLETTGTATVNDLISNGSITGTAAQFTTINSSANTTVNALSVNTSAVIGTSLQAQGGIQATPIGNVTPSTAQFTTVTASGNVVAANLNVNNAITVGSTIDVTGILTVSNNTASTSNVTGAIKTSGGIGVGGNLYVGNRIGWVAANSVSAVYQIYNPATNSLDTIFE